jgi:hypothetical protein
MNNSGTGDVSGTTYNGSAPITLSYNTIGAQVAGNYVTLDTTQTITGKKTFSNAFGDNDPIIALTGTSTATFQYLTTAYNASLEAGKQVCHFFGRASSTKNSGYIGYQWNAAGSNDNFVTIGHYGNDHILKIYGDSKINTSDWFGVAIKPEYTFQVYNDSDVWHSVFGGGTGQIRIGGQTSSGGVIQAVSAGTNLPNRLLYLQRDGSNVIISGTTDTGDRLQVNGTTYISSRLGIGASSGIYSLQLGTDGSLANSIRMGNYQVPKNTRQYIGYVRFDSGLFESSGNGDTPSTVLGGVAGIRIVNTEGTLFSPAADNSVQLLTHIYNGGSRVALHASYSGYVGINGIVAPSEALHVSGSIRQTTVTSSMLKTDTNGVIVAAVAGTDYVVPSALTGYVTLDTTQTITGQKTISRNAAAFSGTTQSFLIDGAAGNGALTINSASAYAYQTFAQAGTGKFEIGIVGTVGAQYGSLYINRNVQTGETGASIYIKKADGFVGINNIDPQTYLHVEGASLSYGQFRIKSTSNSGGESSIHYGRTDQTLEQGWTVGQGVALIGNSFGFYTGSNVRLALTTGGNVLIGTTTDAGYKLDVSGTGSFSGNVFINGTVIGTDQTFGGAYRTFAFGTNSNGFNRIFAANDASDGMYLNAATGQGINFRVNGGGANVFTVASTGAATFSSDLYNNGLFRTRGSSNDVYYNSAGNSEPFGAILGAASGTSTRTAFFRSSITSAAASVWWGLIDSSGRNIPCAAIDGTAGGGLTFWNNTGGSGGGTWTKIFEYNADGVGINTTPSATYKLNVSGSVQATSYFESSDMRLKKNIKDYDSDEILNISAKIYEKDGKLEVGYLAQDLQSVLKCSVSEREDGYLDLSYRQVHTAKIAMLEKEIAELKQQLKNK